MKASNLRVAVLGLAAALTLGACSKSPDPKPQQGGGIAAATLLAAGNSGTCLIVAPENPNSGIRAQIDELKKALSADGNKWVVEGPVSPVVAPSAEEGQGSEFVNPGGKAFFEAVDQFRAVDHVVTFLGMPPVSDPRVLEWLRNRKTLVIVNLFDYQAEQLKPLLPQAKLVVVGGAGFNGSN